MSGGPRLRTSTTSRCAAPPCREDDARRFYGGLLGLPELEKPPALAADGAWFALDGGALNVGMTDAFVPAGKAHPGLRAESVDALDELARRLAAEGHPVEWDEQAARAPGASTRATRSATDSSCSPRRRDRDNRAMRRVNLFSAAVEDAPERAGRLAASRSPASRRSSARS